MGWIQTFTGKQFWPLNPKPEDFDIEDIAHSLSHLCRFNGHCQTFYSVGEHCVRVSHIVPEENAMWGLLHDASEAYMADLPRPIKRQIQSYQDMELKLLELFANAFGLSWPIPDVVFQADDVLLATEKRDLMSAQPASWGLGAEPRKELIVPVSASEAKAMFLARYWELKGK